MDGDVVERPWLRRFTKLTCLATLFLVFMGGQVKSHDAGLSVPDWPTSFHYNMFLFPMQEWVGGIFHEHVHRLIASGVGLLTLIMTFWIAVVERRKWVKNLAFVALAAVIVQGILGGLTVLYLLPDSISIGHGMLAQTFFVITLVLAYAYSKERKRRFEGASKRVPSAMAAASLVFVGLIYMQLFLGAVVRHTDSALAIPDFPTTAGHWIPWMNDERLDWINEWRLEQSLSGHDLPPATMGQAVVHLLHRFGALAVLILACVMTVRAMRKRKLLEGAVLRNVAALDFVVLIQITLGMCTVWSKEMPIIATFHVVTGAALLGLASLLALRVLPLSLAATRRPVVEPKVAPIVREVV